MTQLNTSFQTERKSTYTRANTCAARANYHNRCVPQTTGTSERPVHDIFNESRTLSTAAGLPSYLWWIAAKCYAHRSNCPHSLADALDPWSARSEPLVKDI